MMIYAAKYTINDIALSCLYYKHRFSYTYGRERINLILRYRVIDVILLPLVRKYTVRKNHEREGRKT